MSKPIVVIVCMVRSSESWEPQQRPHPWHRCAGGGAVHSIKPGPPPLLSASLEPEHCLQEPLHRLPCRNCGELVVADMGIGLHARVCVRKRLAGLGIDDDAERLFPPLTSLI